MPEFYSTQAGCTNEPIYIFLNDRFDESLNGFIVTTQTTSCILGKKMFNHEGHEDHEE
jgi:hypothetical protein